MPGRTSSTGWARRRAPAGLPGQRQRGEDPQGSLSLQRLTRPAIHSRLNAKRGFAAAAHAQPGDQRRNAHRSGAHVGLVTRPPQRRRSLAAGIPKRHLGGLASNDHRRTSAGTTRRLQAHPYCGREVATGSSQGALVSSYRQSRSSPAPWSSTRLDQDRLAPVKRSAKWQNSLVVNVCPNW
jgi:hypothetical protein